MMRTILVFILQLILVSCVGTVADPDKVDKSLGTNSYLKIDYSGIHDVFPVAHDAVQVVIPPVTGDNIYSYMVFLNGNFAAPVASSLVSELKKDSNGKYNMIVRNLRPGETYLFSVRVYDVNQGLIDGNTKKLVTSTFSEERPVFNGIKKLENVYGNLANSALKLSWVRAAPASITNLFDPNLISSYRIYYKKLGGSWQNIIINDPDLTSYTVTGLDENAVYYFYMRALDSRTPAREDENLLEFSKATPGSSLIDFNGAQSATVPNNISGLNHITLNWNVGKGPFQYYRVFYTSDLISYNMINGVSPDPTTFSTLPNIEFFDIYDTNQTSSTFFVSKQATDYLVAVVACSGLNCLNYDAAATANMFLVTTIPPVAPYTGLDEFQSYNEIDVMNLSWVHLPDGTRGGYNSYKISAKMNGGAIEEVTSIPNVDGLYLESIPGPSSKSARVLGLTLNNEFCFKVESRIIHTAGEVVFPNNTWKCIDAEYKEPSPVNFISPGSVCHSVGPSSFKVMWNPPTSGDVSHYQVFISTAAIDFNSPGFFLVAHDHSAASFSYEASGLLSNTAYNIAVRPIYKHATLGTFNLAATPAPISCNTNFRKLIPGEWISIMALGQKTNGLNTDSVPDPATDPRVIPELFLEPGDKYLDGTVVEYAVPAEFTDVYDVNIVPPTNSNSSMGSQGIVRLAWLDFQFTKLAPSETTNYFTSGQTDPTIGYRVYRQAYLDVHLNVLPAVNDPNWSLVSGASIIKAKTYFVGSETLRLAVFPDYTLPAPTTAIAGEAKSYWYKVVPVMNGSALPLADSTSPDFTDLPADYIVKVVVPPRNMASVHRWAVNRETCKRLKRPYDRNNQYRCLYNGLLSQEVQANKYYDFGGHFLIDRFEMSCKFSRSICNNTETAAPLGTVGNGDCIGVTAPTLNAANQALIGGTVWYNRSTKGGNTCQVYEGGFVSVGQATNKLAATSNEANLPPLGGILREDVEEICSSRSLSFKTGDVVPLNYQIVQRLPKKHEYVAVNAPAVETFKYKDTEQGLIDRGCSLASTSFTKNAATYGLLANQLDLNNFRYPVTRNNEANGKESFTGPFFTTGSAGTGSTSQCVGRYGVQDSMGNAAEWSGDGVMCSSETNCLVEFGGQDSQLMKSDDADGKFLSLDTYRNSSAAPAFSPNGFAAAGAKFFSMVMGLPLSCGNTENDGCKTPENTFTDDIRFSRITPHPLKSVTGAAAAFLDPVVINDQANLGAINLQDELADFYLAFAIGNFPCKDSHNAANSANCPATHTGNGRYSYSLERSSTVNAMIGGRCGSMIKEDETGGFIW